MKMNMKVGTRIGLIVLAVAVIFSVIVIVVQSHKDTAHIDSDGYQVDDDGILIAYPHIESVSVSDTIDGIQVTGIADDLFTGDSTVTTIVLPDTVKDLGTGFKDCSALKGIYIGAGVSEIKEDMFTGDNELTYISVDEKNPYYSSDRGCVYNAVGDKLLIAPPGNRENGNVVLADGEDASGNGADGAEYSLTASLNGSEVVLELPVYASESGCIIYRSTEGSDDYEVLAVTEKGRTTFFDNTAVKGSENSYYVCQGIVVGDSVMMENRTSPVSVAVN